MPHYSRFSRLVVDVPAEAHDAELAFWQGALGQPFTQAKRFPEYHWAELPGDGNGMLLQRLGDGPARVHIDIHTSDRAAEVARLSALGATMVDDGEHWAIMRDPAGLVFCVIPDEALNESNATAWD
jgi:catechol 2,3-dioxygenase-like lactoylglutathione lyase family enzyme